MIYTAVSTALPSDEDKYIPLCCDQLEEERAKHNAEITVNRRGHQLVCFLTTADGNVVGKARGWPGDKVEEQ